MEQIYSKLKSARKLLALRQEDIQKSCGLYQGDISTLERGRKKFIPTAYITFLAKNGVDLNLLFDEKITNEAFTASFEAMKHVVLNGVAVQRCKRCDEKDERIADLKEHLKSLESIIAMLKGALPGVNQSDTAAKVVLNTIGIKHKAKKAKGGGDVPN